MHGAVRLGVLDRRPAEAVNVHAGEGDGFELVQGPFDLRRGRRVFGRPGQHAGGVALHERQAVRDSGDHVGVSPEYLDVGADDLLMVLFRQQVGGGAGGAAGAVGQEFDVHRAAPGGRNRESCRSMAFRAMSTCMASLALL